MSVLRLSRSPLTVSVKRVCRSLSKLGSGERGAGVTGSQRRRQQRQDPSQSVDRHQAARAAQVRQGKLHHGPWGQLQPSSRDGWPIRHGEDAPGDGTGQLAQAHQDHRQPEVTWLLALTFGLRRHGRRSERAELVGGQYDPLSGHGTGIQQLAMAQSS